MTTYYKINYKFIGKRWNWFYKNLAKKKFLLYRSKYAEIFNRDIDIISHQFKKLFPLLKVGDEGSESYRLYVSYIDIFMTPSLRPLNKTLKWFKVGMNPETGDFRLILDSKNYVDYDLTPVYKKDGD